VTEFVKSLVDQGGFAVTAVAGFAIAWRIYRDSRADAKAHREEMDAFQERYLVKANTWITKHQ
jgi:hypothetical protein